MQAGGKPLDEGLHTSKRLPDRLARESLGLAMDIVPEVAGLRTVEDRIAVRIEVSEQRCLREVPRHRRASETIALVADARENLAIFSPQLNVDAHARGLSNSQYAVPCIRCNDTDKPPISGLALVLLCGSSQYVLPI